MKKMTRIVAALMAVALIASLAGCGSKNVATVNGVGITTEDFEALAAAAQKQDSTVASATAGSPELLAFRRQVLDSMIETEFVRQDAKKQGVEVKDADVEAQLTQIKSGFSDDATFNEALASAGMTLEQLQGSIRDQLTYQALYDKVAPAPEISDAEIKAYYDANKAQFQTAAQSQLSHILISVPTTATADEKAAAKATAEKVLKELQGGADFAALAKKYSEDPGSKDSGGDLGWSSTDSYVAEFKAAADKLKKGELSGLVETDYGYHIILKVDEKAAAQQALADVTETIKANLVQEARNKTFTEYLDKLKAAADIKILDKELAAVTPTATDTTGQ
ncbi:MAG: hypothetical protein CVT59_10340 [Actinobacteria bacterium HGW-Actinobacteria-1]|nr:MAG: hypothetical protein CVT59_10340 [Actinobacteria bacterium HGW-Actinobacteria-1]